MDNLFDLFTNAYNKFMENIKDNSNNGMTDKESFYLNIIYNLKKLTLTKFAEVAKVTKPAASQIINKFINKGYVTKTISDKDKRVCYIELTERLKKSFNEGYKKINKVYEECLSFLTEQERKIFKNILLKINDNL